jgi:WD40 repeat protein
VKIWDVTNGRLIKDLQGAPRNIDAVAFSPDGTFVAASIGDTYMVWNVSDGKIVKMPDETLSGTSPELQNRMRSIAFNPDGTSLVAGQNGVLTLLSDSKFVKQMTFPVAYSRVENVVFSPDGSLLAASMNDYPDLPPAITLWDIVSGAELPSFRLDQGYVLGLAFSPDGKSLAAGIQKDIYVWNIDLESVLRQGCSRIYGYLKHSSFVNAEDRGICDNILSSIAEKQS